eukprot:CAMPEP_0206819288 /NCGR_PEP_ID=MMETSP0975-20121206/11232_1 /ASSEMBLY_ACC=CAM_ASM_000399 /TAXON_ID=483370 /ORGANISM="non described non described, Strain CCMP2097" /LENGTH=486 /DNA_ID=CAMNT_0054361509 /DNA_START=25 /DNA_END=1485 /DNA_ORIENTATION=-
MADNAKKRAALDAEIGASKATMRRQRRREIAAQREASLASGSISGQVVDDDGGGGLGRLADVGRHDGEEDDGGMDEDDAEEGDDDHDEEEEEEGFEEKRVRKMTGEVEGEEEETPHHRFNEGGDMIEPFNLRNERQNDGFFDANGNFVWKKDGEEPDEWLAQLDENQTAAMQKKKVALDEAAQDGSSEDDEVEDFEAPGDAAASARRAAAAKAELAGLLMESETVVGALRRLGRALKADKAVKPHFEHLTELADELLRRGDTNIYNETRETLSAAVAAFAASAPAAVAERADANDDRTWEYEAADGQVYGPYATQDILDWRAQGFFTGAAAVPMRRAAAAPPAAPADDFLADMDEDDEAAAAGRSAEVDQLRRNRFCLGLRWPWGAHSADEEPSSARHNARDLRLSLRTIALHSMGRFGVASGRGRARARGPVNLVDVQSHKIVVSSTSSHTIPDDYNQLTLTSLTAYLTLSRRRNENETSDPAVR